MQEKKKTQLTNTWGDDITQVWWNLTADCMAACLWKVEQGACSQSDDTVVHVLQYSKFFAW